MILAFVPPAATAALELLQLSYPASELLKLFPSMMSSSVALLVHSNPKKPAMKYSALFSIRSSVVVRAMILVLVLYR